MVNSTVDIPSSIPAAQILSALHDHSLMITLNPLVIAHHPLQPASGDSPSKSAYSIRDRIAYLPFHLWDTEITYTASFENTPTGVKTVTHAPAGLEICAEWKVLSLSETKHNEDSSGEARSIIEETATVTCNALLMPFVKYTMRNSHEELKREFVERLKDYYTGK